MSRRISSFPGTVDLLFPGGWFAADNSARRSHVKDRHHDHHRPEPKHATNRQTSGFRQCAIANSANSDALDILVKARLRPYLKELLRKTGRKISYLSR